MTRTVSTAVCIFISITAAAETDVSDVQDSTARAAAESVMQLLATVNEYTAVVNHDNQLMQGTGENARLIEMNALCEQSFRRPNLQNTRCEHTKHISPTITGSVTENIFDGTYWWHFQYNNAEQERPRRIRRRPLEAFADAGLTTYAEGISGEMLLRPFDHCDIETLTLESETGDEWIFTSKPRHEWPLSKSYVSIKLMIGKSDGILREAHYDEGSRGHRTVTVSDVQLNPSLSDTTFNVTPPEGIAIEDNTKDLVESLVSQREHWEEYEPPTH